MRFNSECGREPSGLYAITCRARPASRLCPFGQRAVCLGMGCGDQLRGSTKTIEEGEEDNTEGGRHERIEQKAQREEWLRMIQEDALGDGQHGLMKMKQEEHEDEAAGGMFRINLRADG